MPGGAPAAGWTLYAPLTLQMGPSMDTSILAMHIMGASSIMGQPRRLPSMAGYGLEISGYIPKE